MIPGQGMVIWDGEEYFQATLTLGFQLLSGSNLSASNLLSDSDALNIHIIFFRADFFF